MKAKAIPGISSPQRGGSVGTIDDAIGPKANCYQTGNEIKHSYKSQGICQPRLLLTNYLPSPSLNALFGDAVPNVVVLIWKVMATSLRYLS